MDPVEELYRLIVESHRIVFFTGAGVSVASGIPDFRSGHGLYDSKANEISPETILSRPFFYEHPDIFFPYYYQNLVHRDAKPNITHKLIAFLEKMGLVEAVVTQNIDGLHTLAGSKKVYELHGSIYRNHCIRCQRFYELNEIISSPIPICPKCGGIIKPDVVLYGENLDSGTVNHALFAIENSDLMIVAGTSLVVEPASSFLSYYKGKNLVIINLNSTYKDNMASLVIHRKCEDVMNEVYDLWMKEKK